MRKEEQREQMEQDIEEAAEVSALRVPVVYIAIKQEGEDELARPMQSLWLSGIAAGIAIFFSVVGLAIFHNYLGSSLLIHLGYCFGFLIVILGRFQLFTEATLTVIIPLLADWNKKTLRLIIRLWAIVFTANLIGVFICSCMTVYTNMLPVDVVTGIIEISSHYIDRSPSAFFMQGIPAGFLIAALVWMMPSSEGGNKVWVIIALIYLISLCGFAHVIAGSGEVFIMMLMGKISFMDTVFSITIPTLAGNIIGGTMLFAMLAHGQVIKEVKIDGKI